MHMRRDLIHLQAEVNMHDDEYANGGYFLIIWFLFLCDRPTGIERLTIGYHSLYPYDADAHFITATADGVHMGDSSVLWDWWRLDKALKECG